MSYTLYNASIGLINDALNALTEVLKKGQAAPNAEKLPMASIHSDMKPLTFQVHVVTAIAQEVGHRLAGTEPDKWDYDLKTFGDMLACIAKAQEVLAKATEDVVNKHAGDTIPLNLWGKSAEVTTIGFANGYALPNIFFHLTTAYDVLRKEGVPLGKLDYLRPFLGNYVNAEVLS